MEKFINEFEYSSPLSLILRLRQLAEDSLSWKDGMSAALLRKQVFRAVTFGTPSNPLSCTGCTPEFCRQESSEDDEDDDEDDRDDLEGIAGEGEGHSPLSSSSTTRRAKGEGKKRSKRKTLDRSREGGEGEGLGATEDQQDEFFTERQAVELEGQEGGFGGKRWFFSDGELQVVVPNLWLELLPVIKSGMHINFPANLFSSRRRSRLSTTLVHHSRFGLSRAHSITRSPLDPHREVTEEEEDNLYRYGSRLGGGRRRTGEGLLGGGDEAEERRLGGKRRGMTRRTSSRRSFILSSRRRPDHRRSLTAEPRTERGDSPLPEKSEGGEKQRGGEESFSDNSEAREDKKKTKRRSDSALHPSHDGGASSLRHRPSGLELYLRSASDATTTPPPGRSRGEGSSRSAPMSGDDEDEDGASKRGIIPGAQVLGRLLSLQEKASGEDRGPGRPSRAPRDEGGGAGGGSGGGDASLLLHPSSSSKSSSLSAASSSQQLQGAHREGRGTAANQQHQGGGRGGVAGCPGRASLRHASSSLGGVREGRGVDHSTLARYFSRREGASADGGVEGSDQYLRRRSSRRGRGRRSLASGYDLGQDMSEAEEVLEGLKEITERGAVLTPMPSTTLCYVLSCDFRFHQKKKSDTVRSNDIYLDLLTAQKGMMTLQMRRFEKLCYLRSKRDEAIQVPIPLLYDSPPLYLSIYVRLNRLNGSLRSSSLSVSLSSGMKISVSLHLSLHMWV